MNAEYKRSKAILTLGVMSLLFIIVGIVLVVLYALSSSTYILSSNVNGFEIDVSVSGVFVLSIGVTSFVIFGILHLIASILILTTKYSNKDIENMRIIMGVLTLILIGPIGAIIFGGIAMNKSKSESSVISTNTDVGNGLEPIIK